MLTIALILFFATTLPTADLEFVHRVLGVNNGIVGVNISTLLTKYKDANFAPFRGSCRWHNQALTPLYCKPQCPGNLQTDYDPHVEGFWTASAYYRSTFGWPCYYGKNCVFWDERNDRFLVMSDETMIFGENCDRIEIFTYKARAHRNHTLGLIKFWDRDESEVESVWIKVSQF
ncbi:hypothetical protein DdX_17943 [Ditylenchus destructor]|uniref:Uncharacterized protein n=1 Tax=Ditylenchus destructor TaxID=166010 RepID=A0AAD4MR16_9BILA|nr:hypothetical protein DdX_17943 [Ditylenchus destructor]